MKLKKFLKNVKEFFQENKNEERALEEALEKLRVKRAEIKENISNKEFVKEDKESLKNKIKIVDDLIEKIIKKQNKLKIKNNKE
ncbi:hypothetical protein AAX26_00510 [Aliarcobacter thereius]|uniref:Uncharacterized protein n=2 Tax=Aliarcobacter thereius TaxID=544718 RepID=A0A1C0B8X5_9BACT|nr:hypothetical protein [Aliarcobacter thereius]OCL88816.1 hypothetical protein AAX26_00510 [Aliarcobacter thereius]OCL92311.1 hypothetical protein AAX25_01049 [Aliarcobacter thereius]OCL94594.1 hypothetical protein AA347_00023 [Aliarcobacter thereius LMG 24486]OCM00031.1 hypothetical protein AAX29_00021 [Aliarcobacter thereius]TLS70835.1 hypothetical protein FE246_09530 [Aliarcobacter thereius]